MKQKAPYPLRIDDVLEKKIKKLAKDNDRSYRAQIENILKKYVAEYERKTERFLLKSLQKASDYYQNIQYN